MSLESFEAACWLVWAEECLERTHRLANVCLEKLVLRVSVADFVLFDEEWSSAAAQDLADAISVAAEQHF